ncbi:MAG: tannase/feruloyl esterase family alpha/beta hydrolase [Gammaproteobacteria bacterium]|nr:tannase/feruloyl esterase family alpha/beta hydrolase [Gammaproteobacteria bacterium]
MACVHYKVVMPYCKVSRPSKGQEIRSAWRLNYCPGWRGLQRQTGSAARRRRAGSRAGRARGDPGPSVSDPSDAAAATRSWSRLFLVPGMGHCGGGPATLDRFDLLTAMVDWVEEDRAPGTLRTPRASSAAERRRALVRVPLRGRGRSRARFAASRCARRAADDS